VKTWRTARGTAVTRLLAGRSNVFLVSRNGRRLLVDTSPAWRWKTLARRLRRLGVGRLDALVLTHSHFDHAGSAARLRKEFSAPVIVHRAEAGALAGKLLLQPGGAAGVVEVGMGEDQGIQRGDPQPPQPAPQLVPPPGRAGIDQDIPSFPGDQEDVAAAGQQAGDHRAARRPPGLHPFSSPGSPCG